jgi:hypothetical protein
MSYEEIKFWDGSFRREWRAEDGKCHREDGAAIIWYYPDGSIEEECFYINGKFLGEEKKGFWAFWDCLTEDKWQNLELLKCLSRFS